MRMLEKNEKYTLLLEEMDRIEGEQRGIIDKTFEMDDENQVKKIVLDTTTQIWKLRQWKKQLSEITTEVLALQKLEEERGEQDRKNKAKSEKTVVNPPTARELRFDSLENIPEGTWKETTVINLLSTDFPEELASEMEEESGGEGEISLVNALDDVAMPYEVLIFDTVTEVATWNDVLLVVCQVMLEKQPEIMATLHENKILNSEWVINFSYEESDFLCDKVLLSNGMWVQLQENQTEVVNLCDKILQQCGYSENDLRIMIQRK